MVTQTELYNNSELFQKISTNGVYIPQVGVGGRWRHSLAIVKLFNYSQTIYIWQSFDVTVGYVEMWHKLSRIQKVIIFTAAAFIVYTLFGFFMLPRIIEYFLQKGLTEALNRSATIEKVRFNPFKLEVQISGLSIKSKEPGKSLFSFGGLVINLESASLPKRALILSELKIVEPKFYLKRNKSGQFNIDDLIHPSKKEDQEHEEKNGEAKFSVNNIELIEGSVEFVDDHENSVHKIDDIHIGLPFISNLKHYVDIYVTPHLSFSLNGAPFEFKGSSKPFKETRETGLDIEIKKLDLTHYVPYLPDNLGFELASGLIDTDLKLNFSMAEAEEPVISVNGTISASDIELKQKGKRLFYLKKVNTAWTPSNLMDFDFHLSKIEIDSPELFVKRYGSGNINLNQLVRDNDKGKSDDKSSGQEGAQQPNFLIDAITLENGIVHYADEALSAPFSLDLNAITLSIHNLSNKKGETSNFTLASMVSLGGKLSIQGELLLNPVKVDLKLKLDGMNIPSYAPYYMDQFKGEFASGKASIDSRFSYAVGEGEENLFKISDCNIAISNLQLDSPNQSALLSVPLLDIEKGFVDLNDQTVDVDAINVKASRAKLQIRQDGSVNFMDLLPVKDGAGQTDEEGVRPAEKEGSKWKVTIGEVALRECGLDFEDSTAAQPAKIELYPIDLIISHVSLDEKSEFDFELDANLEKNGKIRAKGKASVNGDSATAKMALANISLPLFQPYVEGFVNGVLSSGTFNWHGNLWYSADPKKGPLFELSGNGGVKKAVLIDKQINKQIFSCTSLSTKDLKFVTRPMRVKAREVSVDGLHIDFIMDEKGELNVKKILNIDNKDGQADSKDHDKGDEKLDNTFWAELALLTIKNSCITFSDFSIDPRFATSLNEIQGSLKGLSSQREARAEVDIEALINHSSKMKISGKVNPFATPLYADLKIDVLDVGLPLFTPYAGRYIGYLIQKGKLNLDLHYTVDNDRIKASNKIFLDQFTLGRHVDSPDAPNLPIRLALSLLTDRKGHIKLNIPVEGKLDDPEFSVKGAVWRAITNLIVKAATSPFALLGAVFGGGEDLQVVPFEPGSAILGPDAQKKLEVLKKALSERPKINVELTGRYDPQADSKALLEKRFEFAIKKEKFNDLSKKEKASLSVEQVTVYPEERPKYLWKAYKHARFKKPTHLFGIVKKQPPEVMERMMKEHIEISAGDLRKLGMDRAETLKKHLIQTGEIDPKRIFIVEPKALDSNSTGPHVEISLK